MPTRSGWTNSKPTSLERQGPKERASPAKIAAGLVRSCTKMREVFLVVSLVDTNILVYRCDPRDPRKRDVALELLRAGEMSGELRIPHQALVEFVNSVTRSRGREAPIMRLEDATRQAEFFLTEFPVLYPNESIFRMALLGKAAYGLAWYDAHLWAYAEHYGLPELLSEDFEHGRKYGTVRVRNPFLSPGLAYARKR